MSVQQLAHTMNTSIVHTVTLLRDLEKAKMVELDPDSEIVAATPMGSSILKLQSLESADRDL